MGEWLQKVKATQTNIFDGGSLGPIVYQKNISLWLCPPCLVAYRTAQRLDIPIGFK